jgi:hypothetical protein
MEIRHGACFLASRRWRKRGGICGLKRSPLYALDTSTGATLWTYTLGRPASCAPVANGVVYVAAASELNALNAATGTLLWNSELGARGPDDAFVSSPAVAHGGGVPGLGEHVLPFRTLGPFAAGRPANDAELCAVLLGLRNGNEVLAAPAPVGDLVGDAPIVELEYGGWVRRTDR